MRAALGEKTFVLIGHPVGHSVSSAIHQAAYAELGLRNCRYIAVDCPDRAAVENAMARVRNGEVAGANVTVPWKRLALELSDERDASASETGAANVLSPSPSAPGRVTSYNTDVAALADELVRGARATDDRARARAVVIGSGGAALAAVAACAIIGASRVTVVARKFQGEEAKNWEGASEFRRLGANTVAWPASAASEPFLAACREADFVVQTTSDGMLGSSDGTAVRDLVPWRDLPDHAFAYDVVYNPSATPFVLAARARGLAAESGLGMLVGQAARAIELWLGTRPRLEPLLLAAREAIARKSRG